MIKEVKTYKVTCDRCGEVETFVREEYSFNTLPKGWGHDDVHDCGLTGYTRTDDLCPKCLKKLNKKNKEK